MSIFSEPTAQIMKRPPKSEAGSLALLGPEDFGRAARAIDDFEPWATFDDYICAREGHAMGLCIAGQDTCLVRLSLSAFESWRGHGNLAPTAANLDAFAALVREYRDRPDVRVAARAVGARGEARHREIGRPPDSPLTIRYCVDLYADWLACLSAVSFLTLFPTPETYVGLLLEDWAEIP
jgi:hypothetical protein